MAPVRRVDITSGDVVVLMNKNKLPLFLTPKEVQNLKWNPLNFYPTITVFWFGSVIAPVMNLKSKTSRKQYEDEERKVQKKIEGEQIFVGQKYQIPTVNLFEII